MARLSHLPRSDVNKTVKNGFWVLLVTIAAVAAVFFGGWAIFLLAQKTIADFYHPDRK
jgi:hypothetical protein